MTVYSWMSAFAAAAGLVLAALAITRAARNALSRPLTLLAANQFAWNTATVFLVLTGDEAWRWLSAVTAPLFPPAALWFVLIFVGKARALGGLLRAIWALYLLQSIAAVVLFLVPSLRPANPLGFLSLVHLACDLPLLAFGMTLIARHSRGTTDAAERTRARLLMAALLVFVAFVSTDMLADAGLSAYTFAAAGSFAFNAMLLVLTFRLGVFSETDRAAGAATTIIAVLLVLVGYLGVFALGEGSRPLLLVGAATVTLGLFGFGRYALSAWAQERVGLERLAMMGRFSAQMAHDLRNPLAAARGAVEFLEEELRQKRSIDGQQEFLTLVREQLDRLARLIDRYQKLGKLELSLQPLEANALMQKVLALQTFAGNGSVKLVTQPAPAPVGFEGDGDVIASALENLVKNAIEALPAAGGQVTVSVRAQTRADVSGVEFEVADTGTGMDARAQERAFELFHTTKAQGSGLGLHFARQVARAHGGDASLASEPGRGTRVVLWFPARPNQPASA